MFGYSIIPDNLKPVLVKQGSRLGRYYPLAFVTVTGAAVMGLEILGTRVIGTVYGSSLFVCPWLPWAPIV